MRALSRWLLPTLVVVPLACGRSGINSGPDLPSVRKTNAWVSVESLTVEWEPVAGATSYRVVMGGAPFVVTATSLSLARAPVDHSITVTALFDGDESEPGCEVTVRPLGSGTSGLALRADPDSVIDGPGAGARYGVSFAAADTDGDAYGDLFVGAPGYEGGGAFFGRGRVQLHKGSAAGLAMPIAWSTSSIQIDAGLGSALAAGDVNGTGPDELVLGIARRNFGAGANEGVIFWYVGLPADGAATYSAPCTQSGCEEGYEVAVADVDGDGLAETFSGAPAYDNPEVDEGALFRYAGASATAPVFDGTIVDGDVGSRFGDSMALGDLDGNGSVDIAGGAPRADRDTLTDQGMVIACRNAGTDGDCPWTLTAGQAGAEYGQQVAIGDVDGDGIEDLVVTAPKWDGNAPDEGRVFVHLGSAAGPSPAPDVTLALGGSAANLGLGLAVLDVNRDGYEDVVAGALGPGEDGLVGLWLGSPTGPSSTPAWARAGLDAGERFHRVADAGDVNGDGAPDVAVGSTRFDGDRGRVSVFHGPPLDGPRLDPGTPRREGSRLFVEGASFTDPASGPKRCTLDWGEGAPLVLDPCTTIAGEHDYTTRSPTLRITVENGYGARAEACFRP